MLLIVLYIIVLSGFHRFNHPQFILTHLTSGIRFTSINAAGQNEVDAYDASTNLFIFLSLFVYEDVIIQYTGLVMLLINAITIHLCI